MVNSIPASKEIGAVFSVFRKLFNLKQEQLAFILGISRRQLISAIEIGQSDIPYGVIYRFFTTLCYISDNSNRLNLNIIQCENVKMMKMQIETVIELSQNQIYNSIDNMFSVNTSDQF